MIAVAISRLGTSPEEEAPALAARLGGLPYEMRLKLAQPAPIVVSRTNDRAAADGLASELRGRGHDVVVVDEAAVPKPFVVRDFRLEETAFVCGAGSLLYADLRALVRAAQTIETETVDRVTERKLRPGAALVTGGLVMTKKVTREEKRRTHEREDLLYVFGSADGAPWLVSEHGADYASLEGVARTQRENFLRVASELRARAPRAAWDERLLAHKHVASRRDLDLRAHMLAIAHDVIYR